MATALNTSIAFSEASLEHWNLFVARSFNARSSERFICFAHGLRAVSYYGSGMHAGDVRALVAGCDGKKCGVMFAYHPIDFGFERLTLYALFFAPDGRFLFGIALYPGASPLASDRTAHCESDAWLVRRLVGLMVEPSSHVPFSDHLRLRAFIAAHLTPIVNSSLGPGYIRYIRAFSAGYLSEVAVDQLLPRLIHLGCISRSLGPFGARILAYRERAPEPSAVGLINYLAGTYLCEPSRVR